MRREDLAQIDRGQYLPQTVEIHASATLFPEWADRLTCWSNRESDSGSFSRSRVFGRKKTPPECSTHLATAATEAVNMGFKRLPLERCIKVLKQFGEALALHMAAGTLSPAIAAAWQLVRSTAGNVPLLMIPVFALGTLFAWVVRPRRGSAGVVPRTENAGVSGIPDASRGGSSYGMTDLPDDTLWTLIGDAKREALRLHLGIAARCSIPDLLFAVLFALRNQRPSRGETRVEWTTLDRKKRSLRVRSARHALGWPSKIVRRSYPIPGYTRGAGTSAAGAAWRSREPQFVADGTQSTIYRHFDDELDRAYGPSRCLYSVPVRNRSRRGGCLAGVLTCASVLPNDIDELDRFVMYQGSLLLRARSSGVTLDHHRRKPRRDR